MHYDTPFGYPAIPTHRSQRCRVRPTTEEREERSAARLYIRIMLLRSRRNTSVLCGSGMYSRPRPPLRFLSRVRVSGTDIAIHHLDTAVSPSSPKEQGCE